MKTLTWQKPGQQNVAQELIKIIINYVAELRIRRNIVLETVQNTHVSIYNINGTLVFSSSVKNNVSIPLQSGFYIVKYNDETKKIAIL